MIALRQLTFARAGRPLVIDASVQLHAGWKVGVVGANGCGKSSLFALIAGAVLIFGAVQVRRFHDELKVLRVDG